MSDTTTDLLELGSAMVHEANGRRGALGPQIHALWPGARLAGPARTVFAEPGDNLAAHVALEHCEPGEVLCLASTAAGQAFGAWGEVLARFAIARGVVGLVTNVAVRDVAALAALEFPVFSAAGTIQGTVKRSAGRHDVPVVLGRAVVRPQDWIVADGDGAAVVRPDRLPDVLAGARAKVAGEERAFRAIADGASTRQALGIA